MAKDKRVSVLKAVLSPGLWGDKVERLTADGNDSINFMFQRFAQSNEARCITLTVEGGKEVQIGKGPGSKSGFAIWADNIP